MSRIIETFTSLLLAFLIGFIIVFLGINLLLGCETWDSSLWTDRNSCLMPLQLFGISK